MEDLKQLVEDFIDYTKTWSISEDEWYWNIDSFRKSGYIDKKHISQEQFERAIREELLYEFIYNINGIKRQLENDFESGYDSEHFEKASKEIEKKIQKLFKDFKIERVV